LKSVLVIGGGLAGLSSGVALAEAGLRVRLVEMRPHLGGRATSFTLPDGSEVDNCQHVTLGCCTNLSYFYQRVGAEHMIRFWDRLYFLDREGRRTVVESSPLPAPLHLAPSFSVFPSLSAADRRGIARAMLAIARLGDRTDGLEEVSMAEWLRQQRQTPDAITRFWRVVLVSALNEELERASARYGVQVFWQAFLCNRQGFAMGVPSVPLAELYGGCRAAIERQGGEVRTRTPVRGLRLADGSVAGVRLDDGAELSADAYVLAVPHEAIGQLLPGALRERESLFANLANLAVSPITGVHLVFDRPVMREPFVALLDRTVQWVFNKSRLSSPADSNPAGEQYVQCVISASYDLVPKSRAEIVALCRAELAEALPATREAELRRATVIKETAATFSPAPGADRWRPGAKTPIPNLFLAGDWTATGWPGTMEGAVRSGYRAAEAILASAGRATRLLRADLPVEPLARMLSGK
jgi:squalene-associated FAD-dependent desaturase